MGIKGIVVKQLRNVLKVASGQEGAAFVDVSKKGINILDENGNILATVAFGASFALITLGVGVYALSVLIQLMNLSEGDLMYPALQQIPTIMVAAVGAVGLAIVLMCIGAGMLIFGQAMPGNRGGGY
jgi:hypothetical protein